VSALTSSTLGAVSNTATSLSTSVPVTTAGVGTALNTVLADTTAPAMSNVGLLGSVDAVGADAATAPELSDVTVASDDASALTVLLIDELQSQPDDGTGEVQLVGRFVDGTGRTCRKFMQTVAIGGKSVQASAIVCKGSGTMWRVVTPVFSAPSPSGIPPRQFSP